MIFSKWFVGHHKNCSGESANFLWVEKVQVTRAVARKSSVKMLKYFS